MTICHNLLLVGCHFRHGDSWFLVPNTTTFDLATGIFHPTTSTVGGFAHPNRVALGSRFLVAALGTTSTGDGMTTGFVVFRSDAVRKNFVHKLTGEIFGPNMILLLDSDILYVLDSDTQGRPHLFAFRILEEKRSLRLFARRRVEPYQAALVDGSLRAVITAGEGGMMCYYYRGRCVAVTAF